MNANIETMADVQKTLDAVCVTVQYGIDTPIDYIRDLLGIYNLAAADNLKYCADVETVELVKETYTNTDALKLFSPEVLYSSMLSLLSVLNATKSFDAVMELTPVLNTISNAL